VQTFLGKAGHCYYQGENLVDKWKPGVFLQQFLSPQRVRTTELRTPTPIMNTETYGAAIRSSQGPGAAAAAKMFYRAPPEQPRVVEKFSLSPETLVMIAETKAQAPIKSYGVATKRVS
jgi:hypothetical protein